MDAERLASTSAAYDVVAGSYAELLPDTRYEAEVDLAMVARFIASLPPESRVLDAGCGTGRMLGLLPASVTGLDPSPGMLAEARRRHPDVPLVEGSLAAMPFRDAAFDGVLAWYSIIHTPPADLPLAFAELARVLALGGLVLCGFQAGTGERSIPHAYGHDVELTAFLHDVEAVRGMLRTAGFDIEARLERAPRTGERHAQGFVMARRRP